MKYLAQLKAIDGVLTQTQAQQTQPTQPTPVKVRQANAQRADAIPDECDEHDWEGDALALLLAEQHREGIGALGWE